VWVSATARHRASSRAATPCCCHTTPGIPVRLGGARPDGHWYTCVPTAYATPPPGPRFLARPFARPPRLACAGAPDRPPKRPPRPPGTATRRNATPQGGTGLAPQRTPFARAPRLVCAGGAFGRCRALGGSLVAPNRVQGPRTVRVPLGHGGSTQCRSSVLRTGVWSRAPGTTQCPQHHAPRSCTSPSSAPRPSAAPEPAAFPDAVPQEPNTAPGLGAESASPGGGGVRFVVHGEPGRLTAQVIRRRGRRVRFVVGRARGGRRPD
jgi:hypothetical protein